MPSRPSSASSSQSQSATAEKEADHPSSTAKPDSHAPAQGDHKSSASMPCVTSLSGHSHGAQPLSGPVSSAVQPAPAIRATPSREAAASADEAAATAAAEAQASSAVLGGNAGSSYSKQDLPHAQTSSSSAHEASANSVGHHPSEGRVNTYPLKQYNESTTIDSLYSERAGSGDVRNQRLGDPVTSAETQSERQLQSSDLQPDIRGPGQAHRSSPHLHQSQHAALRGLTENERKWAALHAAADLQEKGEPSCAPHACTCICVWVVPGINNGLRPSPCLHIHAGLIVIATMYTSNMV